MSEDDSETSDPKGQAPKSEDPKGQDELALDLMKFIAVTTGYGKGLSTTGFGGKGPRTSEEYAESLLELFDRCRSALRKNPK